MDIEQLEALALGDRVAALAALLPGTAEHDYWRGVHLQHGGMLDEVDELLARFGERHPHDELLERLRRRQLLLRAGRDLPAHADELRLAAGVTLDDEAETVVAEKRLPSRLDPALVDGARLLREAVARRDDLGEVATGALPELIGMPLDATRRRNLLARLERADVAGVVAKIAADLDEKSSQGFGSLAVHGVLTLEQLHELARLRPAVRTRQAWVDAVLARMVPAPHVDWRHDLAVRAAVLDELLAFAATLAPAFNGVRAHILCHRLVVDRALGTPDRARLLAYLDLPRKAPYSSSERLHKVPSSDVVASGALHVAGAAGLDRIHDDEALVRELVAVFLERDEGADFAARLDDGWLQRLLAETRLLAGALETERWATLLGPAATAELRDRVEITLTARNRTRYREGEPVALEVDVKNVRELVVKVFRINDVAYFLARGGEVDTTLDLDGMVASDEHTVAIDLPAIRRSRRVIELPACARPGTYVVELIGGGLASRALIRKGSLHRVVRVGAAGPAVRVLDEVGRPLAGAHLWLGGKEHAAGDDGWIRLPFSTSASRVPILLCHGELARVSTLDHPAERYALAAGLALERESLVAGRRARILLRPSLTVAGARASVALIEEPRVEIFVSDQQGVATTLTQPVALRDDAESVIEFFVPQGTAEVTVRLMGHVRVVSTQTDENLFDDVFANVNQIDASDRIEMIHLATTAEGHALHVVGKTGEARVGRPVAFLVQHRHITRPVSLSLETDERGVIELGRLDGVERIEASLAGGTRRAFVLGERPDRPDVVTALAGDEVVLPAGPDEEAPSLLELRGGKPAREVKQVAVERGALVLRGLAAGEYRLLPGAVRVVVAPRQEAPAGWALAGEMLVELRPSRPVARTLAVEGDELVLRISGAGPETRVHVIGLRFRPDAVLPRHLRRSPPSPERITAAAASSAYVSGRDLGDEIRYVLERRRAPRRPGSMLEKPWLLLNPWALRTTTTAVQDARKGDFYGMPAAGAPMPAPAMQKAMSTGSFEAAADGPGFPSLDFLLAPAVVLANLRPDAEGVVRVPLADLGAAQLVRATVVDPELTTSVDLALPASATRSRDLRLMLALDPARHHREERGVEAAPAGTRLVVEDTRVGKLQLVDTVARAHSLLLSLTDGDTAAALRELAFVTTWHTLGEAARRALYSKHACHELHLFLARKDPAFFEAVVRPYLANRRDKTLVDRWLLGESLAAELEPWAFGRLNSVERILVGRSVAEARDSVARLIGDAVDLIPPDPERDARLVSALLGAEALTRSEEPAPELAQALDEVAEDAEEAVARPKAKKKGARPSGPGVQVRGMAFGAGGGGGDFLAADVAERDRMEPMYRPADRTQEWAETSWRRRRVAEAGPELIPPNRFWRDLAAHREGPFLSPRVGDCTTSFADAMCALAFLDLPFVAGAHATESVETRLTVTVASHALAARTRIVEVAPSPESSMLVGQSAYRGDDRWEWDGAEQRQKRVVGPLVAGVVYGCQVVVSNPTNVRRKLDVLLQIPRGALPVANGFVTRTLPVDLAAYATQSLEYAFYFPRAGTWSWFPAHVSGGEELVWAAAPAEVEVAAVPTGADAGSWSHVSQHGSVDDVLAFLGAANLGRVELERIAWRMHDGAAFARITALLAARHVYHDRLWAYALAHGDRARTAEWLRHQESVLRDAAPLLDDGLAAIDPIVRGWYEHLEYAPLVNARAHQLGAKRRILNDAFAEQMRAFLDVVAHRARPTDDDCLAAACYLLGLDRVDDALPLLARVDRAAVATRLQHDYLAAYAACCRGDLEAARALVAGWLDHPVDRWRQRFAAVAALLDETAGTRPTATIAPDRRDERMERAAARQPALDVTVEKGAVALVHHNVAACRLRFFRMDIELLFSRQPFVQGDVERFSFIDPGAELEVALAGDGRTLVPLPAALRGQNLVVEAVAPGLRRSAAGYAHDLSVQLAEQFGQVRVLRASTQTPLAAAYVKAYGRRRDGQVRFFKDGYSDVRGRFDYATLSTDDLDHVERFAILVVSDEAGSAVLEASPPPR